MPDPGAPTPQLPPEPDDDGTPKDPEPQLAIPLPPDGIGSLAFWRDQIRKAQRRLKKEIPLWKANLSRYRGERPKLSGVASGEVITVNLDFYNTEQKKAQLFFQNPNVIVAPKGIGDSTAQALAASRATIANYYLGPDELNAGEMVDSVLFDHLCPAGLGASVIGYEEAMVDVALPGPSPMAPPMAGSVNGAPVAPPPGPTMPKRVWHRYYWERISPEKLLRPVEWTSTNFEQSPWLGYALSTDPDQVGSEVSLPRRSLTVSKEDSLVGPNDKEFQTDPDNTFVIWYRASVYDATVKDPTVFRRLVLRSEAGDPDAIIHEASPFQTIGPDGSVTAGLRHYPIHLLFLRTLTASAWPQSDCTVSRGITDELSLGRTQMMLQKRRNLPQRGVDRNRIAKPELDKMVAGDWQGIIPLDGDPDAIIKAINTAPIPRENFTFNEICQQDADRLWALGANQQSVATNTKVTATQSSLIQQATDTRMTKERNRVLHWYASGAEKLMSLLERFATQDDLAPLIGAEGWQLWAQSLGKIPMPPPQPGQPPPSLPGPGRFLFSIKPDSSVRTDAAEDLQQLLNAYNMLARDPHVNRVAMLAEIVTKFGLDPSKLIVANLPPQPPDAPKVTVTLKAEDLQNASVIQLLQDYGITITADTVTQTIATATGHPLPQQPPQPPPQAPSPSSAMHPAPSASHHPTGPKKNQPHPGAMLRTSPLTQHQLDQTGERPGAKGLA